MKGIIVGFGNMGQTHYDRYSKLDVGIPIVIEVDKSKRDMARSKGIDVYESFSEVPSMDEIDFVDICTPTHLHYRHITEAMRHNKAIFIEKPVVMTKKEVENLRKFSYPHPIFVGEVEQYNPKLSEFLDYQGIPRLIEISRKVNLDFFLKGTTPWFLDEKLSGGIVLDLMIHDISMLVAKYGKPVVIDVASDSRKYECVDEVEAKLSFGNFDAKLYCTWTDTREDTPITVSIKVHGNSGDTKTIFCDDYMIRDKALSEDSYYLELKEFIKSVENNKVPYGLDIYLDAVEIALEIIERVKEA